MSEVEDSRGLVVVPGVQCAAGSIGIKRDGIQDAALYTFDPPADYAGVFTTNQFRSACVESALERLHAGKKIHAVLVTSGNANAGTGLPGRADTERLASGVALELGCRADEVIVLHTGVIGVPLRSERLLPKLAELAAALSDGVAAGLEAAEAMMTTDTFPKQTVRSLSFGNGEAFIGGVAKGAGMIHPRLATMLVILATNLAVRPEALQVALGRAAKETFNRISVDGDTSPNDSVVLLATGAIAIGQEPLDVQSPEFPAFVQELTTVCEDLAKMIVRDGEGATKFIEIRIAGAASDEDAEKAAIAIATSPLVKTAFFGRDFNPGRMVSAIGRSGAAVDFDVFTMAIGGINVFAQGQFEAVRAEDAERAMAPSDIVIDANLGQGEGSCRYFTCDLTYDYVRINAEYTT